jgi:hypothetical protein
VVPVGSAAIALLPLLVVGRSLLAIEECRAFPPVLSRRTLSRAMAQKMYLPQVV